MQGGSAPLVGREHVRYRQAEIVVAMHLDTEPRRSPQTLDEIGNGRGPRYALAVHHGDCGGALALGGLRRGDDVFHAGAGALGQEQVDGGACLMRGAYCGTHLLHERRTALARGVLLVHLPDTIPDHDVPNTEVQRALDAPRLPGDVDVHAQVARQDGAQGLQPARHRQKELHALHAQARQRFRDAHLVLDSVGQVRTLLAVAYRDIMQDDGMRRHGHLRAEVVWTRGPGGRQPRLLRISKHGKASSRRGMIARWPF